MPVKFAIPILQTSITKQRTRYVPSLAKYRRHLCRSLKESNRSATSFYVNFYNLGMTHISAVRGLKKQEVSEQRTRTTIFCYGLRIHCFFNFSSLTLFRCIPLSTSYDILLHFPKGLEREQESRERFTLSCNFSCDQIKITIKIMTWYKIFS